MSVEGDNLLAPTELCVEVLSDVDITLRSGEPVVGLHEFFGLRFVARECIKVLMIYDLCKIVQYTSSRSNLPRLRVRRDSNSIERSTGPTRRSDRLAHFPFFEIKMNTIYQILEFSGLR